MKYSELIDFEPLTTVIKIADDSQAEKRKHNLSHLFRIDLVLNIKISNGQEA